MTHFHGIFYGKCAVRYVGGVLEFLKLYFRGLISQFDVKNANFMGLIAKIGHMKSILASRTHLGPFSRILSWESCLELY